MKRTVSAPGRGTINQGKDLCRCEVPSLTARIGTWLPPRVSPRKTEWWVADYGEKAASCYSMGLLANDSSLMAQGLKMLNARAGCGFRRWDGSNYLEMQEPEFIGCRNDQEMPGHVVYLSEDKLASDIVGTDGARMAGQARAPWEQVVGYFKEGITTGQYYANLVTSDGNLEYAPYFPDDLNAALAATASVSSSNVLPMTAGQPNFASADEQDMWSRPNTVPVPLRSASSPRSNWREGRVQQAQCDKRACQNL